MPYAFLSVLHTPQICVFTITSPGAQVGLATSRISNFSLSVNTALLMEFLLICQKTHRAGHKSPRAAHLLVDDVFPQR
jgi:hypothetical protein